MNHLEVVNGVVFFSVGPECLLLLLLLLHHLLLAVTKRTILPHSLQALRMLDATTAEQRSMVTADEVHMLLAVGVCKGLECL